MAREISVVVVLAALAVFGVFLSLRGGEVTAQTGLASYYDLTGNVTASGDVLTRQSWTAAHPYFPFGSELTVCYGNACIHNVVVNDRGPARWTGNVLDLHIAPAEELGLAPVVGEDYVRFRREIPGHWDGVYWTPAGSGRWVDYAY
jgi:rare lipoprotein A